MVLPKTFVDSLPVLDAELLRFPLIQKLFKKMNLFFLKGIIIIDSCPMKMTRTDTDKHFSIINLFI